MARFRIRFKLASGQPVIIKPEADDIFTATANAGKMLRENGHSVTGIELVQVRALGSSKSSIYFGKPNTGSKRGKKKVKPSDAAVQSAVDIANAASVPAVTVPDAVTTPASAETETRSVSSKKRQ